MSLCREGIVDLSVRHIGPPRKNPPRLSGDQIRQLRRDVFSRHSAHDLRIFAREEKNPGRQFAMLLEAGKRMALEGHTFEAREILGGILNMLDSAGENKMRMNLHAFFLAEARKVRPRSLGLAVEFMEMAGEIIEPIDKREGLSLRRTAAVHCVATGQFWEAGDRRMRIAYALRKDDPACAEEEAKHAARDFARAAERAGEQTRAELAADLGRALSLLAELYEAKDRDMAVKLHVVAGDAFLAGVEATSVTDARGMASRHYVEAKRLGGDASVLDRRIAACEPERMGCVVLTPEEGRAFMEQLAGMTPYASTDDKD